ncbi:MAG: pyridoxal phosphate-dependent aminotransferase [Eubacteriales bacterium]|nr:pyridoxal phosphate-dependent aminotransferase [Eubacteriales bacterium]
MVSEKMLKFGGNSAIRAMFEEGKRMAKEFGPENVYDFSLGNPSVEAPSKVNETIIDLVKNEDSLKLHGYMPNPGYPEVRKKVADSLNSKYNTSFSAEDIIMVVGAASGLNVVLKTILNPCDEVIVSAPYFMEYRSYVSNYDGKLISIPGLKGSFQLDLEAIEKSINKKTKAIILNSPNNPTGVIYTRESLEKLAEILRRKNAELGIDIVLVSDEPYRELSYDGYEVPFLTNIYENTIICYSFSKSLSLPGERIGYLAVSDKIADREKLLECLVVSHRILGSVNAPSLMQKVIERCIDIDITPNVEIYDANRKLLYNILIKAGFEPVYPAGAFYMWLKSPIADKDFVDLCKKYRILVVPGSSFEGEGYVRVAYCVSKEMIERSENSWFKVAEELGLKSKAE